MSKTTILTLVRYVLIAAGSYFVAKGVGSEAIFEEITGSVIALAGAIWSLFEERKHTKEKP